MNLRLFLIASLATAVASAANAAPVLRSEVTVNHPIVTVGDMFEDAGSLAERALFRAPEPGTTGVVSLDAVRQATGLIGLTDYVTEGVLRVRVARDSALVDHRALTDLVTQDLGARGIVGDGVVVDARFNGPDLVFNAEAVAEPAQLVSLRYLPASGTFSARFLIAGRDAPVDVDGRIELMVEAPHLAGTRAAGTILAPTDIEMKLVPLKQAESNGVASIEQLIGRQLVRQSRGGVLLKPSDVKEPRVVERNAMVTVMLNTGPMTLTVKGQALNNAAAGDAVQVLNPVSRKVLFGTALPSGVVAVSSAVHVAGL